MAALSAFPSSRPIGGTHHWSGRYAAYIVARQDGKTPEEAAGDGKIHMEVAR